MENKEEKTLKINSIYQGDSLEVLKTLPDKSIDCCMTSPPYWALRDYGVKGQIGLESHFDAYVNQLCNIFDEMHRVLKDEGTCWVNIGDTYANAGSIDYPGSTVIPKDQSGLFGEISTAPQNKNDVQNARKKELDNVQQKVLKDKCLVMTPFRFALEMVNRGWILRNTIIWRKNNCMPSSVTDRFTVDFEYVFFFVKQKKYWFETQFEPLTNEIQEDDANASLLCVEDADASSKLKAERHQYLITKLYQIKKDIRDEKIAYRGKSAGFDQYNNALANAKAFRSGLEILQEQEHITGEEMSFLKDYVQNHFSRPEGRNKRTVWTINTKPLKEAHFAAYPEELCETPIKSGCPAFICKKCGKARETSFERPERPFVHRDVRDGDGDRAIGGAYTKWLIENPPKQSISDCGCNAGFIGGIVLDPFFGSGTTGIVALKQGKRFVGIVALKQGKRFVGIDLNPEYIEIAKKRLHPYLTQTKLF